MEKFSIRFKDNAHKEFFMENIKKCHCPDCYHEALFYTLGISADCRKHVKQIYDFSTGCIKLDCLKNGWITSSSARTIRLAFNLFNNGAPTVYAIEDDKEKLSEYGSYTPAELFCCSYAPYFLEAIKLRYPEYCLQ